MVPSNFPPPTEAGKAPSANEGLSAKASPCLRFLDSLELSETARAYLTPLGRPLSAGAATKPLLVDREVKHQAGRDATDQATDAIAKTTFQPSIEKFTQFCARDGRLYEQLNEDLKAFQGEISRLFAKTDPLLFQQLANELTKLHHAYASQKSIMQECGGSDSKLTPAELATVQAHFAAVGVDIEKSKAAIAEGLNAYIDMHIFGCQTDAIASQLSDGGSFLKKLWLKFLDFIPFTHTNHLKNFEFDHQKQLKAFQAQIVKTTNLAAEIIGRHPTVETAKTRKFDKAFHKLYFKILPKLNISPFSTDGKMAKVVQNYLHPELAILRAEKKDRPALATDAAHKLKRKIAKAELAIMLGHGSEANKGTTGTMLITDINNKPIGVHKISSADVPFGTKFKNFFRSFFGQLSYLSQKTMAQPQAEKMAYLISRDFHFDLAPPSADAVLKNKGVLQLFVSKERSYSIISQVMASGEILTARKASALEIAAINASSIGASVGASVKPPSSTVRNDEAKTISAEVVKTETHNYVEAIKEIEKGAFDQPLTAYTEAEKTLFQKFALFDYLIGNLDRHEENWFVIFSAPDAHGKRTLQHIKAIDNANAFPKKHPKPFMKKDPNVLDSLFSPGRNQYKWKNLGLAEAKFTDETKEFIKRELSKERIEEVIKNIVGKGKEMPDFFDANMLRLLYLRADNLREKVLTDQTPAELANAPLEAPPEDKTVDADFKRE